MTRFTWARTALALALALGMGAAPAALAQDDGEAMDDIEMDFEEPASEGAPRLHDLDIQLTAHDDEEFPRGIVVTFLVRGGADLGMATGFLVEDAADGSLVFQDGYLEPSEDDPRALIGMGGWGVETSDCGTTRTLRVVVVSEDFDEEGDALVTRLAEASGTLTVPQSYCASLGTE